MYSDSFKTLGILFSYLQSTGVSIFFLLSGFLITTLLINEKKRNGTISFTKFYIKRFFRIIPPFYFYIFYIFYFSKVDPSPTTLELFSALLFLWNYILETENWYYGHSWSLSIEEQFYIVWPYFVKNYKFSIHKLILACILVSPLLRVFTYYFIPEYRSRISILFHTRVDMLMFGCYLAFLKEIQIKYFFNFIKKFKLTYFSIFFLTVLSPVLRYLFAGKFLMTIGYSLEGISILIIFISIFNLTSDQFYYRVLNSKVLTHIGSLSYGLYIWQQYFLSHSLDISGFYRFLFLYLTVLGSYLFIEYPSKLICQKVLSN